jgi:superfamily II DNA or RNA helicase
MSAPGTTPIEVSQLVMVEGRPDLGVGEVVRLKEIGGALQADVLFADGDARRVETVIAGRLRPCPGLWERLAAKQFDPPLDFLLKQLAYQFPLQNAGGELSNSRTQLLPHQILLTHAVVNASRRRFLVADEVGLGKTIETGMIIRELMARGDVRRVLIVCPAGLTRNWQQELNECFRLDFEIVGRDFVADRATAWERHSHVIGSIDKLKKPPHSERVLSGPKWDLVVFDEAHHLTRRNKGKTITQNYKFAESLRGHTRDMLFLSATPHQGDQYQFWSLIRLLDDELFESPEAMLDNRGLLNRVMFRRIKREVTDAVGHPIFMRRQVHSQKFPLGIAERSFYDKLTEYLREGYGVAGIGQARTTTEQRAIGFVMATFQKIMSSSPRAIKQALRRRLLVLLARKQMKVDAARARRPSTDTAQQWFALQDEMVRLAIEILGLPLNGASRSDGERYILQVKQRLARRMEEEITEWVLDTEEEFEDALYADAEIPDEANKVRELVTLVPEGTDRKFDTLVRAIEEIRREFPKEKFLIFTQYRETLEFLNEELEKLYGRGTVSLLHGGPLEDKIEAVEKFWDPEGARFLISTSAGGEGINLQVCRVMFNYDLPWNPMAVEQRIGRLHRYGQHETVQVYNLVAEDTVEERIYFLLEEKLHEIAATIGKVDERGDVVEDFRSEILGFLGSSPNYQELYKRALVDRDYRRTEAEIAEALQRAREASEALRALTQDLDRFDLEHYRQLQGQFGLDDLRKFTEKAVVRLGGVFVPVGDEVYRIETPTVIREKSSWVLARYDAATFSRDVAMRRKKIEFMGLGHPFIDALISSLKSPVWRGEVSRLGGGDEPLLSVRWLVSVQSESENGKVRQHYRHVAVNQLGSIRRVDDRHDVRALLSEPQIRDSRMNDLRLRTFAEADLEGFVAELRASGEGERTIRTELVGLAIA